MSVISSSVGASAVFASGAVSSWLGDTLTAIQNSQQSAGILGALASPNDGSLGSFLSQGSQIAGNFATIAQTSVTNASAFYAQIASQNHDDRTKAAIQKVLADLSATQNQVKPHNTLDPVIFLGDGTTIDTENNIMTKPDGTQYDTVTGALYVDPSSVIQMANGAYLDTQNNIMTLPDGTKIDTVTGLKISTSA
jgi:hypothetical protein